MTIQIPLDNFDTKTNDAAVKFLTIVGCVILLFAGCATAPTPAPPLPTERTYARPFDKVWNVIVAGVSADYPVQAVDKASGLLETRQASILDGSTPSKTLKKYGYDPKILLEAWTGTRCSLTFYVFSPNPSNTVVRVTARIEGFDDNITHNWQPWASNGVLENQYLDRFSSALAN